MDDLIKDEKKLFSSLKNGLLNDYIKIDKSFIPKPNGNKLNRFYSEDNSFWFARLKIKDKKTIYYFGFDDGGNENVKPDLILKFNAESSLSPIKFVKNKVAILTKLKNNNLNYAKKLSKNFKIYKKEDFYFFILSEIESTDIFDKIKLFVELIDFDIDLKSNYIIINDEIPNTEFYPVTPKDILKNNIQIIKIISFLKNSLLNDEFIDLIINFLFVIDENQNYTANSKIIEYYVPINDYLTFILNHFKNYEQYLGLDVYEAFNLFKENFYKEFNWNNIFSSQEIYFENGSLNDNNDLFNDFLILKDTPKIKFHLIPSYGLSDEDISNIFDNIKIDIDNGIINSDDEPELIIERYIEQYISENNSKEIIKYYEKFIESDSYNELLKQYPILNEIDIEDIKNKIKMDIDNVNLTESDINKRFEIYFSKKYYEILYNDLLSKKFKNIHEYRKKGFKDSEIQDIFNEVSSKIKNWHDDWTIFDTDLQETIDNIINQKKGKISSNVRLKFEELYPNKRSVRLVLNKYVLPESDYNKFIDILYKDIFNLKIRIDDLNDDLIIKYYNYI